MSRLAAVTVVAPPPSSPASIAPLIIVLAAYAGLMGTSFSQAVYGLLIGRDRIASMAEVTDSGLPREAFYDLMVFEAVDTIIVVVAVVLTWRPLRQSAAWHRLGTWLLSFPGLAVLLTINVGYHLGLQALFNVEPEVGEPAESLARDGWWVILSTCIQPAVVEELFFRFLLLGHLRHHLGLHAAVWLSSLLFGMAHLGNVFGWPVLILIGGGLGYARVLSGGLALPVLLHFLHNLVVCVLDDATR